MAKAVKKSTKTTTKIPAKAVAKTKSRAVKSKGGDWGLAAIADGIRESGLRRDAEHKEQAERMREALPKWVTDLPTASHEGLITLYDNALQGGYTNHYAMVVLSDWKDAIRAEMIRRMTNSKRGKG